MKMNYKEGQIPTKFELREGDIAYNVPDKIQYTKLKDDSIVPISDNSHIEPEQTFTLLNGWVNYSPTFGGATFQRVNGTVFISGLVKGGAVASVVAVLPVGYRPAKNIIFSTTAVDAHARLNIDSNGNVAISAGSSSSWQSICCSFTVAEVSSGLRTLPLTNGWVAYGSTYGTPSYTKVNGIVYIEGLVKNGTSVFIGSLPLGYRPKARHIFATTTNPNVHCRLDVATNGVINHYGGSNTWVSICCSFVADET